MSDYKPGDVVAVRVRVDRVVYVPDTHVGIQDKRLYSLREVAPWHSADEWDVAQARIAELEALLRKAAAQIHELLLEVDGETDYYRKVHDLCTDIDAALPEQ